MNLYEQNMQVGLIQCSISSLFGVQPPHESLLTILEINTIQHEIEVINA